jgi:isoamyl acetate esterase
MSDLPRVLLLGDSIRHGYQPWVAKLLGGKAEVIGPIENCQCSYYTLLSLDRWIEEVGKPDIVHWNNGIHDSGHHFARCPAQIPFDMYRANLGFILDKLTALTDKIIWATITPVHPDKPFIDTEFSWRNEEIDKYNAVARELMESRGVQINDLGALVRSGGPKFFSEDQLHLSDAGQKACATAVAGSVGTNIE